MSVRYRGASTQNGSKYPKYPADNTFNSADELIGRAAELACGPGMRWSGLLEMMPGSGKPCSGRA